MDRQRRWMELGVPARARELVEQVRDVAFQLHCKIGPGYRESTYRRFLVHGLRNRGVPVEEHAAFDVEFEGMRIGRAREADILVDGLVVVEVKALVELHPVFRAQVISYLQLSGAPIGLLFNFNTPRLVEGSHWFVHPRHLARDAEPARGHPGSSPPPGGHWPSVVRCVRCVRVASRTRPGRGWRVEDGSRRGGEGCTGCAR
jgi:GxxExxY protein